MPISIFLILSLSKDAPSHCSHPPLHTRKSQHSRQIPGNALQKANTSWANLVAAPNSQESRSRKGREMPAWWTPDFTYWLLPAALIGVPVIAGGIFALAQVVADGLLALGQHARPEENAARGIAAGSIAYRVMAVFLVLAGIIEWAIGGSQALLARSLIADYPRRVLALVQ